MRSCVTVSAERALRQWTFRPFVLRGKPSPVQVILEVSFPDPVREAEHRLFAALTSTRYECERRLEASPSTAKPACAEAVKAAEALPHDRDVRATAVTKETDRLLSHPAVAGRVHRRVGAA